MGTIKHILKESCIGPQSAQDDLNQALRQVISESAVDPRMTAASMMVSAVRLLVVTNAQSQGNNDEQIRKALHTALDNMLAGAFEQRNALHMQAVSGETLN